MWLGILLMIITGIFWGGSGVLLSACAKRNTSYKSVQFFTAVLMITSCLLFLLFKSPDAVKSTTYLLVFAMCFGAGVCNYFNFVFTEMAMKKGPNGLVWSIMQSGMIGSFLMGVLVFNEAASWIRYAGLAAIVTGVIFSGIGRKKEPGGIRHNRGSAWVIFSIIAMILVIMTHCFNTLPSFVPGAAETGAVFRTLAVQAGIALSFAFTGMRGQIRENGLFTRNVLIMGLIAVVISAVSSFVCFYHGLDILAKYDSGGLGYPVSIGVCIVVFSLYCLLFLKEKLSLMESVGMLLIISGIVAISLG